MPNAPERRAHDAVALIDLLLDADMADPLGQVESRRLGELRAVLGGRETLRSLAEKARAENRRREGSAERLLRFLPGRLRARLVNCFR